jgi:hypothetical protein
MATHACLPACARVVAACTLQLQRRCVHAHADVGADRSCTAQLRHRSVDPIL